MKPNWTLDLETLLQLRTVDRNPRLIGLGKMLHWSFKFFYYYLFLPENTEELNLLASEPIKSVKTESVRSREKKDANSKTSTKERCRSPHRTDAREEHQRHSSKSSEKIESLYHHDTLLWRTKKCSWGLEIQ